MNESLFISWNQLCNEMKVWFPNYVTLLWNEMKVFFLNHSVQDLVNMNDYEYSWNEYNNIKNFTKDGSHNHNIRWNKRNNVSCKVAIVIDITQPKWR